MSAYASLLKNEYGIDQRIIEHIYACKEAIAPKMQEFEQIRQFNSIKVLRAFQECALAERHFFGSTGYGLSDEGKYKLSQVFAKVFGAEDAIVSPLLASGTHTINVALYGLLRPLDTMLCITGTPYDTLVSTLGLTEGSKKGLSEFAINYSEIALTEENEIDLEAVRKRLYIDDSVKVVYIQRSRGYKLRPALTIEQIGRAAKEIKKAYPRVFVVVDNCYGEFTEMQEPTEVGADVIIGSLIKNPGAGIAPTGGYIAGTKRAIKQIEGRFTCMDMGMEIGSYAAGYRSFFQGLYLAPNITCTALKGAALTAEVFSSLGYEVFPKSEAMRSDITQAILMKSKEELISFVQAVQKASPVDSNALPYPDDMAGYESKVIMASGSFIQGSSIELSADAPLRAPYTAYFQGGLTEESIELALMLALKDMHLFL